MIPFPHSLFKGQNISYHYFPPRPEWVKSSFPVPKQQSGTAKLYEIISANFHSNPLK